MTDSLIGAVIGGRYQLIRRIGKGGMGVVYEADHLGIGKRVAVKILLEKYYEDQEVIARFEREARTASAVGDQHIVEVFDAGVTDDGRSYLVMELLIGMSLADVAQATGPMAPARAVPIVRQILRGLSAAHAKGIIHRDMKPENVFLVQKPEHPDFVKIMDFGISKFIQSTESKVRLTATGAVIGTPVYMAPEQALGTAEIDARVDLYAVGVMLYELLAGRPPFEAPSYIALVTQHLQTPPPPLGLARPDLPPTLVAAVHRALEKDPADRFANATAMALALPTDAQLANLDGVTTLTGRSMSPPVAIGSTTPGSGRARAAKAAITPGGAAAPTTARKPAPAAAPSTTRLRRWPWAAAMVAGAAALGAAIVVVALRPSERPATKPAAGSADAPPAVTTGALEIVTEPAGAIVELDGEPRGTTPVVVAGLAAKVYEVRLRKDGYTPLVLRKSVREGRDETLSAVLAREPTLAPSPGDPRKGRSSPPRAGSSGASAPASGSGSGSTVGTAPTAGSAVGSSTPPERRPEPDKRPTKPGSGSGEPTPPNMKGNPFE